MAIDMSGQNAIHVRVPGKVESLIQEFLGLEKMGGLEGRWF